MSQQRSTSFIIPHAIVRMEVECCSDVELTSIPTGNLLTVNDFLQVLHRINFSFSTVYFSSYFSVTFKINFCRRPSCHSLRSTTTDPLVKDCHRISSDAISSLFRLFLGGSSCSSVVSVRSTTSDSLLWEQQGLCLGADLMRDLHMFVYCPLL